MTTLMNIRSLIKELERERELMHGIVLKKKILIMNEKRGRIAPFSSRGDLKVLLDKVYIYSVNWVEL